MNNEGGCDRLSPGIGSISYVKDLLTEEIVTTKFRCSHFTSYHSKSDGFGWVRFTHNKIFCIYAPQNNELNTVIITAGNQI